MFSPGSGVYQRLVVNQSSIQLVFLRKVVRQSHTDVTSLCMQFEKIGSGLLREAFRGEGSVLLAKRELIYPLFAVFSLLLCIFLLFVVVFDGKNAQEYKS